MIKKLSIICTILALICAVTFTTYAVPSPQSTSYYGITVNVKGTGRATSDVNSIEIGSDDTCTFTATETDQPFVFWNIEGDYDIVSGDYDELVFTICPKTDITAIATFDDGLLERVVPVNPDTSLVSPKTGDDRQKIPPILIPMIPIFVAMMIVIINRNNRRY